MKLKEFYFPEGNPSLALFNFIELEQHYPNSLSAELVADGMVRLFAICTLREGDPGFVAHMMKRGEPDTHWAIRGGEQFALRYDLAMGDARALSTEHRDIFYRSR